MAKLSTQRPTHKHQLEGAVVNHNNAGPQWVDVDELWGCVGRTGQTRKPTTGPTEVVLFEAPIWVFYG